VEGTEIPQLYLHSADGAGEPLSVLSDVDLWPGEMKCVSITLSRYDLFDMGCRQPVVAAGLRNIHSFGRSE